MSDPMHVSVDFTKVINETKKWAEANLKLSESKKLVVTASAKLVDGEKKLVTSIVGMNEAGEKQLTVLERNGRAMDVLTQKSTKVFGAEKQVTEGTIKGTQALEQKRAATEAMIKAEERRAKAAEAARKRQEAKARGQGLAVATFVQGQLRMPETGVTPGTSLAIAKSTGALREFVTKNRVAATTVQGIWRDVANDKFRAFTGANAKIQDQVFRLQQLQAKANVEIIKSKHGMDRFGKSTKKVAESSHDMLLSWTSIGRIVAGQIIRRAFLSLMINAQNAVREARRLTESIGEVQTISQESQQTLSDWAGGLRDQSDAFGIDILNQAEAAYQAVSNQIAKGADTFLFLESANKLALATVSDTSAAVNALTGILNSYSLGAEHAEEVSTSLFKAVELGRVRLSEIANSIGNVTAMAAPLGITFNDVNAALATLTIRGIAPNVALTQLRGIIAKLIQPTTEMKKLFREIGVETGEAAISTYGFANFLDIMERRTGGSTTELGKLISRLRGLAGATILAGKGGSEKFVETLAKFESGTESFNKAVDIVRDNVGRKLAIAINKIRNTLLVDFGLPIVEVAGKLVSHFENIDKAARVLAKGGLAAIVAAMGVVVKYAAVMALTNPFGLLLIGIVAAGTALAYLIEQHDIAQSAFTDKIREEEKKRRKIIDEAVQANVDAAIKGAEESARATLQTFAGVIGGINIIIDGSVDAFAELAGNVKRTMKEIEQSVNARIAAIRAEISTFKSDIQSVSAAIEKLKSDTDKSLFDLRLGDLGTVDQFKLLRAEYERLVHAAEQATGPGQSKLVLENLSKAAGILKQIQDAQKQADATNADNDKKRVETQKKLSDEQQKGLKKIRDLQKKAAEAPTRKGRATAQQKIAEEMLKLRSTSAELKSQLSGIVNIDLQRLDIQRLITSEAERHTKILEDQRAKDEAALKIKLKLEAEAVRLQGEVQSATRRVEAIDVKDILDAKTVSDVNILLEDRLKRIQDLARLAADERLQIGMSEAQRQSLLDIEKELAKVSQARIAAILFADERERRVDRDAQIVERIKGLKDERVEIEANRESILATIDLLTKSFTSAGIEPQLVTDLLRLRDALLSGKDAKEYGVDLERIRTALREVAAENQRLVDMPQKVLGLTSKDLQETLDIEKRAQTRNRVAARDILTETSRLILVLSNQLRAGDQLLEKNKELLFTQDAIDDLMQSMVSTVEQVGENTDSNAVKTEALRDRVIELQKAWAGSRQEAADMQQIIKDSAGDVGQLIQALEKLKGIGTVSPAAPLRQAKGGRIGTDTVPAMLSPGEFIMNAGSTRKFYSQLVAMNGARPRGYETGGSVSVGDVNISMQSSGNESVDAAKLGRLLKREIRRGTLKL